MFNIINAAITPGTHPQSVNKNTIIIEPHPLPITDKGGKNIANKTLNKLIVLFLVVYLVDVLVSVLLQKFSTSTFRRK